MANLKIFFFLLGDSSPSNNMFPIIVSPGISVGELKKQVLIENQNGLKGIDARDLRLWKLNEPIPVQEVDAKVPGKDALSTVAKEMLPGEDLSDYFSVGPQPKHLHIIVQPPQPSSKRKKNEDSESESEEPREHPTKRRAKEAAQGNVSRTRRPSPPMAWIDSTIAERKFTVDALYKRLNHYHFVLVRGTPASGKSTLAQLLRIHINREEPEVEPIVISTWPDDKANWVERLGDQYNPNGPNTIIIDEAQLTYWDLDFWNQFVKPIVGAPTLPPNRVILFAAYGSPEGRITEEGTPPWIPQCNRVGLRPVDHGDQIAVAGLFFTAEEFADMVQKTYSTELFEQDLLDHVFHITAGHAGAAIDLLKIVTTHSSYRNIKRGNKKYSLENFRSSISLEDLWSALERGSIFRRGLPRRRKLQDPRIAQVFCAVLTKNFVTDEYKDKETLGLCFRNGWLHATIMQDETVYIFTTQLHQWFVEYYLGMQVLQPTIKEDRLLSFAIAVIRLFSRDQLSSTRTIIGSSSKQRPPEAQFQDEFYRCCHTHSGGSLITFPEFGDANGRIDFYIPFKKWGVELLRDGDRLANHSSRFTNPGAYSKMDFEDYVILDFRTKPPSLPHPGMPKLFHVVFEKDLSYVNIVRGSSLESVEVFVLLK